MEVRLSKFAVAAMAMALCGYAAAQTPQLVSANAQLNQNVDTKSATEGQVVTAKLTSAVKNAGQVELAKGTTLIGKVAQVEKANGSAPARLTLTFDQAKLPNGQTVAIKATLLSAYPEGENDYYVQTGLGGSPVPEESHVIPAHTQVDQTPGGPLGNVELRGDVASDVSGVFTSTSKDINLRRGTQFQLAIAPEGGAQGAANGQ